ncbi:hypothetical protein [Nocardioides montaniterrae]
MRSTVAAAAVLLGLIAVSGCDAATLDATDASSTAPALTAQPSVPSSPTSTPRTKKPSRRPATSAPATDPAPTGEPKPTAMATDTANPGARSAGVPTTYAAAHARLAALRSVHHPTLARFSTPGDAVYCVLRDPYIPVSCELRSGAIRDPGVCGQSMADSVGRIQIGDDGAVPQCNTDTIREPGAPTVAPPSVISNGSITCAVERIGVTCVNTRTHAGFFLTPGKYAAFSH